TLVAFLSNGGRPATPSTVEIELPKPKSALPASTASTLAMPAPGSTWILIPSLPAILAMAPPRGYQDPTCGPVIRRTCCALAAPATSAPATPAATATRLNVMFMKSPSIVDGAAPHGRLSGAWQRLTLAQN